MGDLYRVINDFKKSYLPRNNIARDEKGDLIADSHSTLKSRKNNFSLHGVRPREEYTAELLETEFSAFETEVVVEKLKRHTSLGNDQIPVELIKTGRTVLSINSVWNKEELSQGKKGSIMVRTYMKSDNTDCNNHRSVSLLPKTYNI